MGRSVNQEPGKIVDARFRGEERLGFGPERRIGDQERRAETEAQGRGDIAFHHLVDEVLVIAGPAQTAGQEQAVGQVVVDLAEYREGVGFGIPGEAGQITVGRKGECPGKVVLDKQVVGTRDPFPCLAGAADPQFLRVLFDVRGRIVGHDVVSGAVVLFRIDLVARRVVGDAHQLHGVADTRSENARQVEGLAVHTAICPVIGSLEFIAHAVVDPAAGRIEERAPAEEVVGSHRLVRREGAAVGVAGLAENDSPIGTCFRCRRMKDAAPGVDVGGLPDQEQRRALAHVEIDEAADRLGIVRPQVRADGVLDIAVVGVAVERQPALHRVR